MVGMLPGANLLSLEASGGKGRTCVTPQTVIHELLHKLGLWHEHMRHDRDAYIRVHYRNIPKSQLGK